MSDLRQQLQELVSEWRKRVVALFPDDLTRRAELERCVSQLDALVRAASPPAPRFDNDVKAEVMPSDHSERLQTLPSMRDDTSSERTVLEVRGPTNYDDSAVTAGAQHPAENTARVDTDVVRGRVDGAAGGVRSAGPPQERTVTEVLGDMDSEGPLTRVPSAKPRVFGLQAPADKSSERIALERLSLALTGGNAATWDEVFHAAESKAGGAAGPQAPPPPEPEIDALMDRAEDWERRLFDYEVAGCSPTRFEAEAQRLISDLMLVLAHSIPVEARGDAARVPPATPQGWQPIETMPHGHSVLVTDGRDVQMTFIQPHSLFPIHWMPKPAAPANAAGEVR